MGQYLHESAVQWQDNTKLGLKDGKLVPIVQEYVFNTYTKFGGYDVRAGVDGYWATTRDCRAAVRAHWASGARAKNGIAINEEAETGSVISRRLLEIGNEIQSGKLKTDKAIAEARKLIDTNTRPL